MIEGLVICPYCGKQAKLVTGATIYPHRKDLKAKSFWQCAPCDAYVGCHPESNLPLGRLANYDLRKAKIRAHSVFDLLWKTGIMNRSEAYAMLAKELDIPLEDCHIGMFDLATCARVYQICSEYPV